MTSLPVAEVETRQHEAWVDVLRVLLIAGVIVAHTATAYVVDLAGWYYDDELDASGAWSTLVMIPAFFGAVFGLGPLFLVAGWFAVRSIDRRGPAGFARSRLLRLGAPLVVFVLVVQPLTDYLGNIWDESRTLASYLSTTEVSVMWFAAALLAISLGYAVWEHRRPGYAAPQPLRPHNVVLAMGAIAVSSFAVWLVWPLPTEGFMNLRVPEWPQGAVLFALGVHAARAGWLTELPHQLLRRLGGVALAGAACVMVLFAVVIPPGDDDVPDMGADWPTLLFALLDGAVAVAFALWFVGWVQRHWPAHGPLLGRAGRASYATYFLHPLVLTLVMLAFAALPLIAGVKFVVVAVVGVPACFLAGYALTRVPGVSTVL